MRRAAALRDNNDFLRITHCWHIVYVSSYVMSYIIYTTLLLKQREWVNKANLRLVNLNDEEVFSTDVLG